MHTDKQRTDLVSKLAGFRKTWNNVAFLKNNNAAEEMTGSREGRKLRLEYARTDRTPSKSFVKCSPQSLLPTYEVPTMKQRKDLRLEIKMKMMRGAPPMTDFLQGKGKKISLVKAPPRR